MMERWAKSEIRLRRLSNFVIWLRQRRRDMFNVDFVLPCKEFS